MKGTQKQANTQKRLWDQERVFFLVVLGLFAFFFNCLISFTKYYEHHSMQ